MAEQVRPLNISENKLILPDREIAVIGTNHGYIHTPFPGRIQTQIELKGHFPEDRLDGLILDSLPRLDRLNGDFPTLASALQRRREGNLNFIQWGVNYAHANKTFLLAGDPLHMVSGLAHIYDQELVKTDSDDHLRTVSAGISLGAIASVTGISRRDLLKLGLATSLSLLVPVDNLFTSEDDSTDDSLTCPPSLVEINRFDLLLAEPRILNLDDYESATFVCLSAEHASWNVAMVLRNAIIAEVLDQPRNKILPGVDKEVAAIAAIVGAYHLVVPEHLRISWLVANSQYRTEVIRSAMEFIFMGVENGLYQGIDLTRMKEDFLNLGRSYWIDPQSGALSIHQFDIPVIQEIVDQ